MTFGYFCYFEIVIKSNCANRSNRKCLFDFLYEIRRMDYIIHIHTTHNTHTHNMYDVYLVVYLYVCMRLSLFYFDSMSVCLHARDDLRLSDLPCRLCSLSHVASLIRIFFSFFTLGLSKIERINRRLCAASIDGTDIKVMDSYVLSRFTYISHFFRRCSLFSLILFAFDPFAAICVCMCVCVCTPTQYYL